jgi:hypothetical protein
MNEKQVKYYKAWLQENIDYWEEKYLDLSGTWEDDNDYHDLCEARDCLAVFKRSLEMFDIVREKEDIGDYREAKSI